MKTIFLFFFVLSTATAHAQWDRGLTKLHWALVEENDTLVYEILQDEPGLVALPTQKYIPFPFTSRTEWSTVQVAVVYNRIEALKAILKLSPDLDYQDPWFGYTALHAAAQGSEEALRLLLEAGANPYAREAQGRWGDDGHSPLRMAIRLNRLASVRLLIEHGADVKTPSGKYKTTHLMDATSFFSCNDACKLEKLKIAKLIAPLSDINAVALRDFTPPVLFNFIVSAGDRRMEDTFLATIDELLRLGADPCVMHAGETLVASLKRRLADVPNNYYLRGFYDRVRVIGRCE